MIDKLLDKIKETIGIGKFHDTKFLIDAIISFQIILL